MTEHINPWEAQALARGYDAWFNTPAGALTDELETRLILRLAQPHTGEKALDVGTGTGHFACLLHELGLDVTAIDASPAMYEVASEKNKDISWHLGAAEQLPFQDESFDLVTCITAVEFMANAQMAIDEMLRVLNPGGRLVLGVLNSHSSWATARDADAAQNETPFTHAHYYSAAELVALLPTCTTLWNSSVFYGPNGTAPWWGHLIEALGQIFCKGKGALLVIRGDKL